MKICYFDAFSGISGDMTVGALVDAGAGEEALVSGLRSLHTGASFRFEKVKRRGIAATKFHVEGGEQKAHRHLPQILEMINRADLPRPVQHRAAAVFDRLGKAEAKVHGIPLEKVHFHEVGAVDSIADIVGACMGLELLGIDELYCSRINTGSGTVNTEHGLLPVPAPATVRLLENVPVYASGPAMELTTPTGAAIAATMAKSFGSLPPMKILTSGYGAGDRDFPEQANVLRVLIGSSSGAAEATTVSVLEANVDDSSPEVLGYAMEKLMSSGALDVSFTPVQMKKNRPGTLVRVIASLEDRESLAELLMAETSTFGVRLWQAERRVQARHIEEVETSFGKIRVKVSSMGDFAPEYEDCRKLAESAGVPLKRVLAEAGYSYLKNRR